MSTGPLVVAHELAKAVAAALPSTASPGEDLARLRATLCGFLAAPTLDTADALALEVEAAFVRGATADPSGRVGQALLDYAAERTRPSDSAVLFRYDEAHGAQAFTLESKAAGPDDGRVLVSTVRVPAVTSAPADWREAARGIPVWEGARALYSGWAGFREPTPMRVIHGWPGNSATVLVYADQPEPAELEARVSVLVPDLSDADTRAAYDRRLALALGAPVDVEACGVNLYGSGVIVKGVTPFVEVYGHVPGADGYRWSTTADGIDTADPLLARALAWPADKRVTA